MIGNIFEEINDHYGNFIYALNETLKKISHTLGYAYIIDGFYT